MDLVDVYLDRRRYGLTYISDGCLFSDFSLNVPRSGVRPRRATCSHTARREGFAYARRYGIEGVHWPIVFCDECLAILDGREPYAFDDLLRRSGAVTAEDVIARKWARAWPQDGRPRRKRHPKDQAWPKRSDATPQE